jgi:hypothetical protein
MKATTSRRAAWLLRLVLGVLLLGVVAAALAPLYGIDLRQVLSRDPPKADYAWLRQGLGEARKLARAAAKDVRRGSTLAAANALEQAILYSRASARGTGTQPIPPEIREQLEPYFPQHMLDRVRWAFPNPNLDLGSAVAAWYRREGGAVTLQDTIVYSTPRASRSRFLWAHELTHALQYEELGLRDFARIYVTNPQLLEQQAWDNARRIVRELQQSETRSARSHFPTGTHPA